MGFDLSSELQREFEQVEAAKNGPKGHQPPRIAWLQTGELWPRDGPSPIRGAGSAAHEAPFGGDFPLDEDLGRDVRHKRKTTASTNLAHAGKESMHIDLPQTTVTTQNATKQESVEQFREKQRPDAAWDFLCQLNALGDPLGPVAERVMYAEPIQGYKPGTRKGLIWVYHGKPPIPVYKVTLDSAERALKSELQSRTKEMRASIHRFGENGAHMVRTEWSALVADLVVERRPGQQVELF
jgi:hypothetical protein